MQSYIEFIKAHGSSFIDGTIITLEQAALGSILAIVVRAAEAGNAGEARKFAQAHVQRFSRYMKKRQRHSMRHK